MNDKPITSRSPWRDFAFFIGLTFALSWGFWGLLLLTAEPAQFAGIAGPIGAFAPPLAAAILTWRIQGSLRPFWRPIAAWRIGWGWWTAVFAAPLAILVMGWGVLAVLGQPLFPETMPEIWLLPLFLLFMVLAGGGQEEPGWRGFALPRLQTTMNAFWAGVVLGLIWAAWHLPLFYFPGSGQASLNLAIYFPYVVGVSILHTWIFNSSGGSVLAVMILHGLVNMIGGFIPMGLLFAAEVATLVGVWLVVGGLLVVYGPSDLSRNGRVQTADLE
jgi:uncharacterized protein